MENNEWWREFRDGALYEEAEVIAIIKQATRLERERVIALIEKIDATTDLDKDEVHCTCWNYAKDVLRNGDV